ncbi:MULTISPECIES: MMPL family transporter [unclassified Streptomyces]|uniref:MMPL family transporter n=1 Tax=unclassified Streptomyces TaxID=2593676 RepID=UPI001BE9961A|nr:MULTISPECIES: MMPL family transporter [unclassified Streptomyces]MBT2407660.1 MMPL family transporter [Streptomyces sp. ISL-21]MBT2607946.1 MMPL family transporter [Streptomyces sp. ISL-87]
MSEVKKPPSPGESGWWTRFVTARPRLSLLLALVVTALAVFAGGGAAARMGSGGWEDPDARSTYATEALEREFPSSQPNLLLLVDAGAGVGKAGVDDPAVAAEAERLTTRLAAEPGVTGVGSYWRTQLPTLRSEDGRQALIAARVVGDEKAATEVVARIAPRYEGEHGPVRVSLGGRVAVQREVTATIQEDLLRAELIALPVTLVLLILVFGSAIAALLPLGVGIVAIIGTNAVLRGLTEFTDVSVFAQNLTTALGLGLAIDYALFIVRRFREELAAGRDPVGAIGATLRTAGRTVLFSALTVAVALSAMLFFPMYFLRSFAYAGVAVVLLAAAAALILLPAALVLLGERVNSLDLRQLWRRRRRKAGPGGAGAEEAGLASGASGESGRGWARSTALVMRRAPLFAVATTAGLLLLGLPFLGVKFGTVDDRQLPETASSHLVQQQIRDGFPGSPGSGLIVLAEGARSPADLDAYRQRVAGLEGVLRVDGPVSSGPGARSAYFSVITEGEAVGQQARDLVGEVRKVDAPFETSVTGQAAVLVDAQDAIAEKLPAALALVVLATLLLVFLLTGSVLIPLQAILLNALSLTAMFGAVVWVFQEGNLSGLLSFTSTGDIETTLPVLMFCIAFGLSMDYGVFLISRIKEEYDRTGDHEGAVRTGLARTGGLITAAAVILAVVMVAIGTSRVTNTKMLGLGIALAVLMDAMVVRSLLVPAVMKLTGKATWWAPGPLRRLHERFGLSEGESAPAAVPADSADSTEAADSAESAGPEAGEPEKIPAGSR